MKTFFTALAMLLASYAMAQTNALKAGVYTWANTKAQKLGAVEKKQMLAGRTLDLQRFEIYTLTLQAGKTYTPPDTNSRYEELIVVKSGDLQLTLNDSVKTVGPGSIGLVLAGDRATFKNTSSEPVTWFVINYRSINPVDMRRGADAGPSFIKNWNDLRVKKTTVGETRAVFDRATTMFGRFDVHETTLNPGQASHPPHTHRVEELILMLTGKVHEQIAKSKFDANAGDGIYLSSQILHGPINLSNAPCSYFAIQWHNLKTD